MGCCASKESRNQDDSGDYNALPSFRQRPSDPDELPSFGMFAIDLGTTSVKVVHVNADGSFFPVPMRLFIQRGSNGGEESQEPHAAADEDTANLTDVAVKEDSAQGAAPETGPPSADLAADNEQNSEAAAVDDLSWDDMLFPSVVTIKYVPPAEGEGAGPQDTDETGEPEADYAFTDPKGRTFRCWVGREALKITAGDFVRIPDIKRVLGYKLFRENYQLHKIRDGGLPYRVVPDEEGLALVRCDFKAFFMLFYPHEIAALILYKTYLYIRQYLSFSFGVPLEEPGVIVPVVITVPANFSPAQRASTLQAAASVYGLRVWKDRLYSEPVAAACEALSTATTDADYLIFDFGGGTLDLTVVQKSKKHLEVKYTDGDLFFGGRDIDNYLLAAVVDQVKDVVCLEPYLWKHAMKPQRCSHVLQARLRLLETICAAKHAISDGTSSSLSYSLREVIADPVLDVPEALYFTVGAEHIAHAVSALFDVQLRPVLERVFENGADIQKVICVGGSCRSPFVVSALESVLQSMGKKNLPVSLGNVAAAAGGQSVELVQFSVVQGAARAAAGEFCGLSVGFELGNILPYTLALNTTGETLHTLLARGSKLPARAQIMFQIDFTDSGKSSIDIYQSISDIPTRATSELLLQEQTFLGDSKHLAQFFLIAVKADENGIITMRHAILDNNKAVLELSAVQHSAAAAAGADEGKNGQEAEADAQKIMQAISEVTIIAAPQPTIDSSREMPASTFAKMSQFVYLVKDVEAVLLADTPQYGKPQVWKSRISQFQSWYEDAVSVHDPNVGEDFFDQRIAGILAAYPSLAQRLEEGFSLGAISIFATEASES